MSETSLIHLRGVNYALGNKTRHIIHHTGHALEKNCFISIRGNYSYFLHKNTYKIYIVHFITNVIIYMYEHDTQFNCWRKIYEVVRKIIIIKLIKLS